MLPYKDEKHFSNFKSMEKKEDIVGPSTPVKKSNFTCIVDNLI